VTGTGRLTVTLTGSGLRLVVRHVNATFGRQIVLSSWPSKRLRGGIYALRVQAPHSWLPEPFTLSAVRVVPVPKRPRHGRHASPRGR
jgi:hypothetical protein